MAEAYCDNCKAKKEMVEAVEEEMKDGRKTIRGKCPDCGEEITKILGSCASPPPPPNP